MNGIINILIANLHTHKLLLFIPNIFISSLFNLFGAWSFLKAQPALTNANEQLEQECSRNSAYLLSSSSRAAIPSGRNTLSTADEFVEPSLLQKCVLLATGLLCNQCLYLSSASDSIIAIILWIIVVLIASGTVLTASCRIISKALFHAFYFKGLALHCLVVLLLMYEHVALTGLQIIILGPLTRQKQIALASVLFGCIILAVIDCCPDSFFVPTQIFFHRLFSVNSF